MDCVSTFGYQRRHESSARLYSILAVLLLLIAAPAQGMLDRGRFVGIGWQTYFYPCGTLTALADGKVLLAGSGHAELFDPLHGTWSVTGSPLQDRCNATATLLQSGRVLVTGGQAPPNPGGAPVASTELYDPATGTWMAGPSMTMPRWGSTATLLADGRVLIAGGTIDVTGSTTNSADLYLPATNGIVATGSFPDGRVHAVSVRLDDGRVLITGGDDNDLDVALRTSSLYDPATGTWSPTGSLNRNRTAVAPPVKLATGKFLIAGGVWGGYTPTAELYDPTTGTWSETGSMLDSMSTYTLVVLPSGNALAVGDPGAGQIYDPATGTWYPSGSPVRARGTLPNIGALLANGDVLFASGSLKWPVSELYRPVLPASRTDFTRDGKSDIVFESGERRRWLFGMNGVELQSYSPMPETAPGWVLAGIGDFDGNGSADLLYRKTASTTDYWIVLTDQTAVIGNGYVGVAPGYLPTFIADFNGDGRADILWENPTGGRWLNFMNGTSVASFAAVPPAAPGYEIAGVGDFNGDGKSDLLWMYAAGVRVLERGFLERPYWIYLMNGASMIDYGPLVMDAWSQPAWIRDINHDGKDDILWGDGTVYGWVMWMNGVAQPSGNAFRLPSGGPVVGVGDFDGTGGTGLLSQSRFDSSQLTIDLLDASGNVATSGGFTVAPGYVPQTH